MLGVGSARSGIDSFMVMDVMRAAAAQEAAGRSVIHMEVGQPATAGAAGGAACRHARARDTTRWATPWRWDPKRCGCASRQLYRTGTASTVAPERVVVTTGSSAAFVLAFLALFDVGDAVALPAPGYPCYRHILSALGQRAVVDRDRHPTSGWMPTAEDVARAAERDGTKGLLVASPANPTGTMLTPERLAELAAACRRHGVRFISDEIYHGLTYERGARDGAAAHATRRSSSTASRNTSR